MLTTTCHSRNSRRLAAAAGLTVLLASGLVGLTPVSAGATVVGGHVRLDDPDPGPIVVDPIPDPGGDGGGGGADDGGAGGADDGGGGGGGADGGGGGGADDGGADDPGLPPVITDPVGTVVDVIDEVTGQGGGGGKAPGTSKPQGSKPTHHQAPGKKHQHQHQQAGQAKGGDDAAQPTSAASPFAAVAVDPPILAVLKPRTTRLPAAAVAPMATREEPESRATPQPATTAGAFRTVAAETPEAALSGWVPGGLLVMLSGLVGGVLWQRRRETEVSLRDL